MGRLLSRLHADEKTESAGAAILAILRFDGPAQDQESQESQESQRREVEKTPESQESQGVGGEKPHPLPNRRNRKNRSGAECEKTHPASGHATGMRPRLLAIAIAKAVVIDAGYVDGMKYDEMADCIGKTDDELAEYLRARVRTLSPLMEEPFGIEPAWGVIEPGHPANPWGFPRKAGMEIPQPAEASGYPRISRARVRPRMTTGETDGA